jgi:hypothetical protein
MHFVFFEHPLLYLYNIYCWSFAMVDVACAVLLHRVYFQNAVKYASVNVCMRALGLN